MVKGSGTLDSALPEFSRVLQTLHPMCCNNEHLTTCLHIRAMIYALGVYKKFFFFLSFFHMCIQRVNCPGFSSKCLFNTPLQCHYLTDLLVLILTEPIVRFRGMCLVAPFFQLRNKLKPFSPF